MCRVFKLSQLICLDIGTPREKAPRVDPCYTGGTRSARPLYNDGLLTNGYIEHDVDQTIDIIAPDPLSSDLLHSGFDCFSDDNISYLLTPVKLDCKMMTSGEDSPSSGRLRPRKLSVAAPQRVTRNSESKTTDEKQSKVNIQLTSADKTLDNPVNKHLCPYCEKYFTIKTSLSKHVARVHSSAASVKCQFCDHAESSVDGAVRHMIESHPNDYFICLDCRTRFQTAQDSAEHKLTCKKQESPLGKPYRHKLRANTKTVHHKRIGKQKNESSTPSKVIAEKPVFNGIVISCELKPPLQQDTADIEDNITTNLILPPNKNIGSTGLQKNAVIVLDDIQWNKRIPANFCFHNSDADQILSRLGVVHRSPRVGESTRRDWYKHIEDSTKFEKCFDTSFYTKVASNVHENLSKYLDGSSNRFNLDPDNIIKTRKSKNSVAINTVEGFPTLLAANQYSRGVFDNYLPRNIAPRHKWKWEHLDLDRNPINQDQIKRYSHVTNCIITLVSSLDIWTQLCMRDKYEAKFNNTSFKEKSLAKQNVICNELKEILESREIPKPSSAIVKRTEQSLPNAENLEFARSLGLVPREQTVELTPAKLSGECVRPRCFICCACGERIPDYKMLRLHKGTQHPYAQVAHYEIVGEVLLDADIMKHLYVPPPQLSSTRTRPPRGIKECTKCNKPISLEDLHQHILDCAGDTPVVKRKCRSKTFGARRRRPRMPDNTIRKEMRKGIRHRHNTQRNILRSRPRVRTEVGDAETIRKMLADLPPKRHRVIINPVDSTGRRTRRDQERTRTKILMRRRAAEERHTAKPMRLREQNNANKHPRPSRSVITKEINTSTAKKDKTIKTTKMQRTLIRKAKNQQANVKRNMPTLRSASVRKLRSAMSNTVLTKDEPIDSNPKKIDLTSGNSSTRQHAGRDNSNSRYQRMPDPNDQSRATQNPPPQDVPLKHSIARLTASSGKHDRAVQFQPHFLVQQDCYENIDRTFMPVGQPVLFENDSVECKLDKPPLDSYNCEYPNDNLLFQKNKNNKPRKGLNDCIAMLKNKLVDPIFPDDNCARTQCRSVHCDTADMPQYQENTPSSSKETEVPVRDHYQTMLPPIPPAHANTNVMSIMPAPLDLSGKGFTCVSTNRDGSYDTLDLSYKNAPAKYKQPKDISDYQSNDVEDVVVDLRVKPVEEPLVTLDLSNKTKAADNPADIAISKVNYQPREHSAEDLAKKTITADNPADIDMNRVRYQPREHSAGDLLKKTKVADNPADIDISRVRYQPWELSAGDFAKKTKAADNPADIDISRVRYKPREHSAGDLLKKTQAADNPADIDISRTRYQHREHSAGNLLRKTKAADNSADIDISRVIYQPWEHSAGDLLKKIKAADNPADIGRSRARYQTREHSAGDLLKKTHAADNPADIDISRARYQPPEHSAGDLLKKTQAADNPADIDISRARYQHREHSAGDLLKKTQTADNPADIDISRSRYQHREHSAGDLLKKTQTADDPADIDISRSRYQHREHSAGDLLKKTQAANNPADIDIGRVRYQSREHSATEPPLNQELYGPLKLQNYETEPILPRDSCDAPPLNIVTTLGSFSQATATTNDLSLITTFPSVSMNTSPMCKLVSSSTNHDSKKMIDTSLHREDTACKETNKIINYEWPSQEAAASHEIQVNKNKESVKSSDTETAKKIAMLPKAIVEILGTMPVASRNQLLNVLPQYMSHTCVDNKPNSEVETTRETATVPGYLERTEIATQTAVAGQGDLLDKSVSETSTTTSNSIHNIASVSRNCETQIESTIYNNGNSLLNTNITPKHDFLTRPHKATPHKTGNEKTASLRAVRIKTADRLKTLHQLPLLNKNVEDRPGHSTSTPTETQNDILTTLPVIQQAEVSSTHICKISNTKENISVCEHIPKIHKESDITSIDKPSDTIKDQNVLKSEVINTKPNATIQVEEKQVIIKSTSALETPQTDHNHSKESKISLDLDNNLNLCVPPAKKSDASNDIEGDESKTKFDDDSEDDISLALIVKQKNQIEQISKRRYRKSEQKSNNALKDTKGKKSQLKNKETLSNANKEKLHHAEEKSQINSKPTEPCKTATQVTIPKRKGKGRIANRKVIECDENSTNNLKTSNDKEQTSATRNIEKETMENEKSEQELKAKTAENIIDTNKKAKKPYSDQSEINIPKDSLITQESSHQNSLTESKSKSQRQAKSKQQLKELDQNVKTSLDTQCENDIDNFSANKSIHESAKSNTELTSLNTISSEITSLPESIDGSTLEQKSNKVVRLKQDNEESPVDIKSNIETEDDMMSQADDHTTVKPLRRSRRGKSLYTEVLSATNPIETIPPKAIPLTKKQLIFSKMLLDEENLKINNKKEANSNTKFLEKKKSEQRALIQDKSPKRKSVPAKTVSRKKQKMINPPEKELLLSTNSDVDLITKEIETSETIKGTGKINAENKQCKAITELSELSQIRKEFISTKYAEQNIDLKESVIIEPCEDIVTSLTDVKSIQPETHQDTEIKQDCSSRPLLFKTDTDSEIKSHEPTSPTNKRDSIKSTCYSNLDTSRRTRSKCLPNTWLGNYDPYDIDLEDKLLDDVDPVNKKVANWLKSTQKCAFKSKTTTKKPNTAKKTKSQSKNSTKTSASTCPAKKYENKSEHNESDDSLKSDVPLTKYVSESTKDIANTPPRCLEEDVTLRKDQNYKKDTNGSTNKCESDHPIPGDSHQKDQKEVNTDSKKKTRGKKKKSNKADHANEKNSTEDTERLKSEQFMESFGFFSERKPRKSNLLATKKISETFHNVDDSDDLDFGTKERTAKKCRRKSSLRDDTKETQTKSTSNIIKKISRKKKTENPEECVCTNDKIVRRETYCAVCEKQYRRLDNFLRHNLSLFHITRIIKKEMHINIDPIEDTPNYLVIYKHHLNRLIKITEQLDKKNKEMSLKSPDAPKIDLPTLAEIMADARLKTFGPKKTERRGLSRDEALFLDCCEMLKKTEPPTGQEQHTLNQVADNSDSRPISKLIAAEKCDPKSDGDVDSITAKTIMESEEVRNLEKDLLSGFKHMIPRSSNNDTNVMDNNDTNVMDNNDTNVMDNNDTNVMDNNDTNVMDNNDTNVMDNNDTNVIDNNGTNVMDKSHYESRNSEILSQTSMTDCLESEVEYRESKGNRVCCTNKKLNKTRKKCLKQKRKRTKLRFSICDDSTDSQDVTLKNISSYKTGKIEINTKTESGTSDSVQKNYPKFNIEGTSKKTLKQSLKYKFSDCNLDLQKASTSTDAGGSSNKKIKQPQNKPRKNRHSETFKSCRDDTDVDTKDEPFKEVNIFKDETVDIFEDKFDKIKRKSIDSEADVRKTNRNRNEDRAKKSQKKPLKTKRSRSMVDSSTREESDSDKEPFQKINIFEDELVDMFEDKFDKIKRKCRSQVAAVKTTPAVAETSKARYKGKTKVQKKTIKGIERKAIQNIIMTKGALKGFESIKVSIPTSDIDMSAITPSVSEHVQRKRKRHTAKKRRMKRYDSDERERRLSKDSQKHLDVYEFIDDDTDMFEFRPSTIKERFKTTFKDKPHTSKTEQVEKHHDESSSSGTDGDDFVYMSDDYLCSAEETENSEHSSGAKFSSEAKKTRKKESIEKNTVMGKIFKHNAVITDKKALGKTNDKQKTNLDQLFDSLLKDEPQTFVSKTDKKEKDMPAKNLSIDEDSVTSLKDLKSLGETSSQSPNPVIDSLSSPPRGKHSTYNEEETKKTMNMLDEIDRHLIEFSSDNSAGVARHRTRRKCAVGKQNVLAETWSSESESEMGHSNSGESVVASCSNKKRRLKRGPSLQAGGKRGRLAGKKVDRIPRVDPPAVTNEELGNSSGQPVDEYAWSTNNDLVESGRPHAQQHGWIVGNSHKKLVTMLAHAKRRNRDEKHNQTYD